MALFFGLFLGAPFGGLLLARMEKRSVLILGISALLICQSAPVLLRLAGLLPFDGNSLATLLTIFSLMMGMFAGSAGIAMNAMGPDVADQHEILFGTRREGLLRPAMRLPTRQRRRAGRWLPASCSASLPRRSRPARPSARATCPNAACTCSDLSTAPAPRCFRSWRFSRS